MKSTKHSQSSAIYGSKTYQSDKFSLVDKIKYKLYVYEIAVFDKSTLAKIIKRFFKV